MSGEEYEEYPPKVAENLLVDISLSVEYMRRVAKSKKKKEGIESQIGSSDLEMPLIRRIPVLLWISKIESCITQQ
ncbi:unnamed protein product [Strongylus vulgaris]|uniref:Uncharacterized protein n=1 Tax=Strongylus vulgaris TaxID=40348 RepID=A0A3P7IJP2_STRVU|nr:unnamed protein product [Strongylus vulgaris]